jgi:hypothetical protein
VSVSADYRPASRELLIELLSGTRYRSALRPLVRPLRPVRPRTVAGVGGGRPSSLSPEAVAEIVAELEDDGKGIPVLLRQYLKLNARLLAFSVDPGFGNVVDALMVVDLTEAPQPILTRYLGREGAASFLAAQSASAGALPVSEPAVVHA